MVPVPVDFDQIPIMRCFGIVALDFDIFNAGMGQKRRCDGVIGIAVADVRGEAGIGGFDELAHQMGGRRGVAQMTDAPGIDGIRLLRVSHARRGNHGQNFVCIQRNGSLICAGDVDGCRLLGGIACLVRGGICTKYCIFLK